MSEYWGSSEHMRVYTRIEALDERSSFLMSLGGATHKYGSWCHHRPSKKPHYHMAYMINRHFIVTYIISPN